MSDSKGEQICDAFFCLSDQMEGTDLICTLPANHRGSHQMTISEISSWPNILRYVEITWHVVERRGHEVKDANLF